MSNKENDIRLLIRKTLSEMDNVSESDILVKAGVNWDEVKPKFLEKINTLISKIDDDQYDDAEDLIGNVTAMLKMWRHKIKKGKTDMVDKSYNTETLDEELLEDFGGGLSVEKKYEILQKIKIGIKGLIAGGFDKEKLKSMIITLIDNPKSI